MAGYRPYLFPLVALLSTGFLLGGWAGVAAAERLRDPYADLDTFARVLSAVETHYVEEVDHTKLVDTAIQGMIGDLDPHSKWLDPRAYREMLGETEGRYQGIGVEIRSDERGAVVLRVLPGGPAERDGLLAGDVIVAVDRAPLTDLSLEEMSALLRGERGSPVELTLERAGVSAPVSLRTVRDRIDLQPVEHALLDDQISYIRLYSFQDGAGREVRQAIQRHLEQGATGVVLDLRDNPGGLLEEAVAVADLFLEEGTIVSTRGRSDGEKVKRATPAGFGAHLPLVLLVNQASASASEVVAGALQDTGRARVVGTRTYGKGTVQNVFPTRSGAALRLTVARYYTPSGEPVAFLRGRDPDVQVDLDVLSSPAQELRARIQSLSIDEEERRAMLALVDGLSDRSTDPQAPPWHLDPAERVLADPQLAAAIRVLRER